jgi:hypothetical protein
MHEEYGQCCKHYMLFYGKYILAFGRPINFDEPHLNDTYFYEYLYAGSGQKRIKDMNHAALLATMIATNTILHHKMHCDAEDISRASSRSRRPNPWSRSVKAK